MPPITFTPPNGRLALDRYDFRDHVEGFAARHNADIINVIPSITIDGYAATNVYSALSKISLELVTLELSGKGFLQIGDGYDTYANSLSTPDTPYDSLVPALDTYLNDVLNNPLNPLYFRIRDGGVIMIKAGTYKFTGTVSVPPGIIILGEGFGTKIVNQIASPAPLFQIKADTNRIPDVGVDVNETFIFAKQSALVNITIADNFVEPKFLGDLSYRSPQNNDSTNPLVMLEEGANLFCDNVNFVGKTVYTLGTISDVTSHAIAVDSSVPTSNGTRLKITNSSIDGFAVPIKFTASGGFNDNLMITNSLIRGYGFLNSDFVAASNNNLISVNDCNLNISGNYLFGNDDTIACLVYITLPGSVPLLQSKANVVITNNNIAVDRSNSSVNTTFKLYLFNTTFGNELRLLTYGNNFQGSFLSGFKVDLDGQESLIIDQTQFTVSTPGTSSITSTGTMDFTSSNALTLTATSLTGTISGNIDLVSSAGISTFSGNTSTSVVSTGGAITVTSNAEITLECTGTNQLITLDGGQLIRTSATATNLNISDEYVIFVDTSGARTITLPTPTAGRVVIIKDTKGLAATNNITIARNSTEKIEGLASNFIIEANYAKLKLVSDGTDWWFV